jgi:SM-20-related protein
MRSKLLRWLIQEQVFVWIFASSTENDMEALFEEIATALAEKGFYVGNGLFDLDFCRQLREEQEALLAADQFRVAGIGRGSDFQIRPEIRSDQVLWLDSERLSPRQQQYWELIAELRRHLKQTLYLPLHDYEAHYAVYPEGSFYKRHIDQYSKAKHRIVSCILYLNEDWQAEHEGQLRLYKNDDTFAMDVAPLLGTFVCFLSAEIPHEVLPTRVPRFSITGWMRTERVL